MFTNEVCAFHLLKSNIQEKDHLLQKGNKLNTSVFYRDIYHTAIHKHTQIFLALIIEKQDKKKTHLFFSRSEKSR